MHAAPRAYRFCCCSPGRIETSVLHVAQASSYDIFLAFAADAVVAGTSSAAADSAATAPKNLNFTMAFLPVSERVIGQLKRGVAPNSYLGPPAAVFLDLGQKNAHFSPELSGEIRRDRRQPASFSPILVLAPRCCSSANVCRAIISSSSVGTT